MKSSHRADPVGGQERDVGAADGVSEGNVYSGVSPHLETLPEQVDILARGANCRVERIVSLGHQSPEGFWYDQAEDEFVVLMSGAAELRLEGQAPRRLAPGDWMLLPAGVRHRVEWTQPDVTTTWLAVFFSGGGLHRASESASK